MSEQQPSLLNQYAAASQQCRDIAKRIGAGYDEHPDWRAAERTTDDLWKQARTAGHTVDEILAASRATS